MVAFRQGYMALLGVIRMLRPTYTFDAQHSAAAVQHSAPLGAARLIGSTAVLGGGLAAGFRLVTVGCSLGAARLGVNAAVVGLGAALGCFLAAGGLLLGRTAGTLVRTAGEFFRAAVLRVVVGDDGTSEKQPQSEERASDDLRKHGMVLQ